MDSFRTIASAILAALAASALPTPGWAQNYPIKPIRFIAGGAGSPADMRVRQVAQKFRESLGQPVIVDNRPGANGAIGAKLAAKAPPDGYTLFNCNILHALNDLLNPDPSSRLNKELVPITRLTSGPLILVIHPSIPAASLQQFIELAKAKPGTLNYASGSQGGLNQLLGELIKSKAGINIRGIPYKFTSAEIPDVLGGHINATLNYFISLVRISTAENSERSPSPARSASRSRPIFSRCRKPVCREWKRPDGMASACLPACRNR